MLVKVVKPYTVGELGKLRKTGEVVEESDRIARKLIEAGLALSANSIASDAHHDESEAERPKPARRKPSAKKPVRE